MKKSARNNELRLPGAILIALAVVCASGLGHAGTTGGGEETPLQIWDDPQFKKQFIGSYGFQSAIEPSVEPEQIELMQEVLPLLSTDPAAAEKRLREIIADPENTNAVFFFTLGNVYFQQERLAEAAELYRDAIAEFPSFRRAHKNLGLILVRQGNFAEAIPSLSRVIELGGADGLTYGLLGYAYSSTENWVPAESAYRNAMLLEGQTLDWKLGLTQSVLKQQKYGEAVTLCQALIDQYPERTDFWLLQANAYIGLERPRDAAKNYEIVRRLGKATPQSLNTLGDIYVNEGLWDLAAQSYRHAIDATTTPQPTQALRRVEILAQRDALPQAQTLLATVKEQWGEEMDPEDRKKMLKIEARLTMADEDGAAEAATVLEEIVALDPLDGEALILLGQHYSRMQETDRAIFYYERAQSIDGVEAEARVRHAQLLVDENRYDEALTLLKRAQEIDSREDVARYLEQVERVARSRR